MPFVYLIPFFVLFGVSAQAQPDSMFVELGRCVSKERSELDFQIFSDSMIKPGETVNGFVLLKPLANPQYEDEVIQVAMKIKLSLSASKELRFRHPLLEMRNKEIFLISGGSTEFTTSSGQTFICKTNRM